MAIDTTKIKNKLQGYVNKIGEVLAEPTIRKTARFATGILESMAYINPENPISVGSAALSMVDNALDSFEIPFPTKTEHFAKKNSLLRATGGLPRILAEAGILDQFPTRIVFTDNSWTVKEMTLDEKSKFYYAENTDPTASYKDPLARISIAYYYSKDFNFQRLFDAIWERYKSGVFVSTVNLSPFRNLEGQIITLHDLSTDECLYLGDIDVIEFSNDLKKFREEGTSRSFMLSGDPGTGKTSFVIEVSRQISNRIIRIDPTVAQSFDSSEFDFLIDNLKPDIIVFDDFDRAAMAQESQHLLFLLENIKYKFPQIIIFATVNHFERLDKALVRPGRFDEILWFDLPGEEIRAEIAKKYLSINSIQFDDDLVKEIAVKTEGLSPVYIKELCIRLRHKGTGSIDATIAEFKRVLNGLVDSMPSSTSEAIYDENDVYIQLQRDLEDEGIL